MPLLFLFFSFIVGIQNQKEDVLLYSLGQSPAIYHAVDKLSI